jgi:hypothetical protein
MQPSATLNDPGFPLGSQPFKSTPLNNGLKPAAASSALTKAATGRLAGGADVATELQTQQATIAISVGS